jgi:hypothetical protein
MIFIFIIYSAVVVPLELTFLAWKHSHAGTVHQPEYPEYLETTDWILSICFFLDLFFNMRVMVSQQDLDPQCIRLLETYNKRKQEQKSPKGELSHTNVTARPRAKKRCLLCFRRSLKDSKKEISIDQVMLYRYLYGKDYYGKDFSGRERRWYQLDMKFVADLASNLAFPFQIVMGPTSKFFRLVRLVKLSRLLRMTRIHKKAKATVYL